MHRSVQVKPQRERFKNLVISIVENLETLPPWSFFIAFPLKLKGGSGSPVRVVALISKEK